MAAGISTGSLKTLLAENYAVPGADQKSEHSASKREVFCTLSGAGRKIKYQPVLLRAAVVLESSVNVELWEEV